MELEVKNIQGKAVKKISVPDTVFNTEMNEHVLHTVVKAYLANQRQGTHATKTKSTISGGGKKPFRQKGTGGARQGSTRNPHQEGGAVAHGPQPRDYTQKTNKKVRNLAMRIALSDRARHSKVVVVDDLAVSSYSTKYMTGAMKSLGLTKALFVDERKDDLLYRSTRNIHGAKAVSTSDCNVHDILGHDEFVITENALTALTARLGGDQ